MYYNYKKGIINPFFRIKKEALKTESGIKIPNRWALLNAKTNSLLGIMSADYEVVLNSQVAKLFDEALKDYEVDKIGDYLDNLQRRWKRRIILKGDKVTFEVDKDDPVTIVVEIFNGYDVRSSFGYELLACRIICENGLLMGRRNIFKESYSHFIDNPKKLQFSIEMKFDYFKENVKIWQKWTKEKRTKDDFINFVNKREYLSEKIKEEVIEGYDLVMNRFGVDSKWGHFNILTYLATHQTKARVGSYLFSNRYKLFERMIEEYYNEE